MNPFSYVGSFFRAVGVGLGTGTTSTPYRHILTLLMRSGSEL